MVTTTNWCSSLLLYNLLFFSVACLSMEEQEPESSPAFTHALYDFLSSNQDELQMAILVSIFDTLSETERQDALKLAIENGIPKALLVPNREKISCLSDFIESVEDYRQNVSLQAFLHVLQASIQVDASNESEIQSLLRTTIKHYRNRLALYQKRLTTIDQKERILKQSRRNSWH